MHAIIQHEYEEAQMACPRRRDEMAHSHRQHEAHVTRMRCEAEERLRSVESEAERRYEGAMPARVRVAEAVRSMVVVAFRTEVQEAQARSLEFEAKAEDLDNRRLTMGTKFSSAEAAVKSRCYVLQVHHDEGVERDNHESAFKEPTAEETIARLHKAARKFEAEVRGLHSEPSERSPASTEDLAILRRELETALQVDSSGEIARVRAHTHTHIHLKWNFEQLYPSLRAITSILTGSTPYLQRW